MHKINQQDINVHLDGGRLYDLWNANAQDRHDYLWSKFRGTGVTRREIGVLADTSNDETVVTWGARLHRFRTPAGGFVKIVG